MGALSNVLTFVAVFTVIVALSFVPDVWAKARVKWPGVFETDNPEPEELPTSFVVGFIVAIFGIGYVGVEYGAAAAVLTIYLGCFFAVIVMHVPPYIRHQYRRVRGRTHAPLEC